MTFYHAFKRPHTTSCEAGNGTESVFNYKIVNGDKKLVKTGETNVYNLIQESLEETKIENIMQKATAGDENVINKYATTYMDATILPTSIAEAYAKIQDIKNEFAKLPTEIKAMFSHNADIYVHEYGSDTFYKKLGFEKKENVSRETKTEEVKNEQK